MNTNEQKHTPGPWHVVEADIGHASASDLLQIYDQKPDAQGNFTPGLNLVGKVAWMGQDTLETMRANARLIASAPALLEACKGALHAMKTGNCEVSARAALEAAISLAEKGA